MQTYRLGRLQEVSEMEKRVECEFNTTKCPICGGNVGRPPLYDEGECYFMEVIDEGRSTIAYTVVCKRYRGN